MSSPTTTKTSKAGAQGEARTHSRQMQRPAAGGGTQTRLLDLQAAAGNRAVSQKLQAASGHVSPALQALHQSGGGQPLNQSLRTFMESRLDADFSRVRIHISGGAAQAAQHLHAQAYTVGQDIVFAPGKFAPETSAGRELLAHELTHVVQQQQAGNASPGSAHEQEASAVARQLHGLASISIRQASAAHAPQLADDPSKPKSPRIIFLDTNVVAQIEAGNSDLEKRIHDLQTQQGAQIYVTHQVYNELVFQPDDPKWGQQRIATLKRLGVHIGPAGTMADRVDIYTRNIADMSSKKKKAAKIRERKDDQGQQVPQTILSEPDVPGVPPKKKGYRNDVLVAAQVRAAGGELLTLDSDFLNASNSEKATGPKQLVSDEAKGLGVKIAPESFGNKLVDEKKAKGGKGSPSIGNAPAKPATDQNNPPPSTPPAPPPPSTPSGPPPSTQADPKAAPPPSTPPSTPPSSPPPGQSQAAAPPPQAATPPKAAPTKPPDASNAAKPQVKTVGGPPPGAPGGVQVKTIGMPGSGQSQPVAQPKTGQLDPRSGLPPLKRPANLPADKPITLYRGTVEPWRLGNSPNVHDTGPGTYYSTDFDLAIDYARQNQVDYLKHLKKQRPAGAKDPSGPQGIVIKTVLDPKKVKILDFYYNENLRKDWNDYLVSNSRYKIPTPPGQPEMYVDNPMVKNLLSGQSTAEVYNKLFHNWAQKKGIDLNDYDVIVSPEYRTGGAQVAIRNPKLVEKLDEEAHIAAIATDKPKRPASPPGKPPSSAGPAAPTSKAPPSAGPPAPHATSAPHTAPAIQPVKPPSKDPVLKKDPPKDKPPEDPLIPEPPQRVPEKKPDPKKKTGGPVAKAPAQPPPAPTTPQAKSKAPVKAAQKPPEQKRRLPVPPPKAAAPKAVPPPAQKPPVQKAPPPPATTAAPQPPVPSSNKAPTPAQVDEHDEPKEQKGIQSSTSRKSSLTITAGPGKLGVSGTADAESKQSYKGFKTNQNIGVGGGVLVNVTEVPDTFPVKYRVTLTIHVEGKAGLGGGAEHGGVEAGLSASVSGRLTASFSHVLSEEQTEKYLADARGGTGAYAEMKVIQLVAAGSIAEARAYLAQMKAAMGSAEGIKHMAEGDEMEVTTEKNLSGGLNAGGQGSGGTSMGVQVGASVGGKVRRAVAVRDGKQIITLTVEDDTGTVLGGHVTEGVIGGGFTREKTKSVMLSISFALDPNDPSFQTYVSEINAVSSATELRQLAARRAKLVYSTSKGHGETTQDTTTVGVGPDNPLEFGLVDQGEFFEEETTDAEGHVIRKYMGSGTGGAQVSVRHKKVLQDTVKDTFTSQVTEDNKATGEVSSVHTKTDIGRTIDSFAKAPIASTAGLLFGSDSPLVNRVDQKGKKLSDDSFTRMAELAKDPVAWEHAWPGHGIDTLLAWRKTRFKVLAANGNRDLISQALEGFEKGGSERSGTIESAVGEVGVRFEFPDEIADQKATFDALVVGDPLAQVRKMAADGKQSDALGLLKHDIDKLNKLSGAIKSLEDKSDDKFTSPATLAEMLRRIAARKAELQSETYKLMPGPAAKAAPLPPEFVGPPTVEQAQAADDQEKAKREQNQSRIDEATSNCQTFRKREQSYFAAVDAEFEKANSWFSKPDSIVIMNKLNDLKSMYEEWNKSINELRGFYQASGGSADQANAFAPNRARWQALYDKAFKNY
jgi:predicted nucleic acid-binding protein